jgi:RNA polymerase sigma-70 factor, ECF subfamily
VAASKLIGQSTKTFDVTEFGETIEPFRRELLVHCYRMLGSVADAEDAMQDVLVKAWQGLPSFEGKSSLRGWLYKIATNACLDALDRRRVQARVLPHVVVPAGDPQAPPPPPSSTGEYLWMGPMPEDLLPSTELGPDARYDQQESIAVAFLTVLQSLPARQRAVVVLRDVLGFSAEETASMLDMSVAASNSALQRARETLEKDHKKTTRARADVEASVLDRFVKAWQAGDASAVASLLTDDAIFSMPPMPLWIEGREAVRVFLETILFRGGVAEGRFRLSPTRANGAPALTVYENEKPVALDVFDITEDGRIRLIVAFLG